MTECFDARTYAQGTRCPWHLWLADHRKEWRTPKTPSSSTPYWEIDELAAQRYPDARRPWIPGGDIVTWADEHGMDPNDPATKRVALAEDTARLVESGAPTIAGGVFQSGNLWARVDMMLRETTPDGTGWRVVTFSSSSGGVLDKPGRLTPDAARIPAFNLYLLTRAGLTVTSSALLHFNRAYVREGAIDVEQLFTVTDCTAEAESLQDGMPASLANLQETRASTAEIEPPRGPQCLKPNRCDFYDYCWKPYAGQKTVLDIPHVSGKVRQAAINEGVVTFADVRNAEYQLPGRDHPLNVRQRQRVDDVLDGGPPRMDIPALRDFLALVRYPLYHLDFETFRYPVPPYDGLRPYQQVPFQYSVHIQQSPGAEPAHEDFLADEGDDPRWDLASHLARAIPADACVLVFNDTFEKNRLKELAWWVSREDPALADHLLSIRDNIVDLLKPFRSGAYVDPAQQGSNSIKKVLPAMFPDDPSLNYANLDGVSNGGQAADQYLDLRCLATAPVTDVDAGHVLSPDERDQYWELSEDQRESYLVERRRLYRDRVRHELLTYCGLDTYAMVRILDRLFEITA